MFVRSLTACEAIVANDLCELRELFHPGKDRLPLDYSLAHAVVQPGRRTLRHHLIGSSEVYYILAGRGSMHIGEETRAVGPGDAIVIPPDAVQSLENGGEDPVVFLALVQPPWRAEIDVRDE